MLIVVIPVFLMAFLFVWKYRPASRHDVYDSDWGYSVWMDGLVWHFLDIVWIGIFSIVYLPGVL